MAPVAVVTSAIKTFFAIGNARSSNSAYYVERRNEFPVGYVILIAVVIVVIGVLIYNKK